MYITRHFRTDSCAVLMLNVYVYKYCTLRIYIVVVSPYPAGRGVTKVISFVLDRLVGLTLEELEADLL